MEVWKQIEGFEGIYMVSNTGKVRSMTRVIVDSWCVRTFKGVELNQTPSTGKQPYLYISLSKKGKVRKRMVHRLVAETFIPNPENKPQVNHIDGNPQNNSASNLEWVTNAENTQHAYDTGLYVRSKKGGFYNAALSTSKRSTRTSP